MAGDKHPVFVSGETAEAVFHWGDAIAALQSAYGQPNGSAALPARTVAHNEGIWLRTLPAIPAGTRYFGAKLMGMARTSDTPGVDYVIVLFDRETSRLAAFVDGNLVTGYRTAATSAAALDRLAPPGPARLAILGSGLEATMHLRAFASVRPLTDVVVFSPTVHKREAFAAAMSDELGLAVRSAISPEDAVQDADIVLAAARSRGETPILHGNWLRDTATIVSIGSTVPEQREIDVSVVDRSDLIVCDTPEEVLDETGDMIAAVGAGIDASARIASLGALMTGALQGRLRSSAIRMFKSVGAGLQDVVIAGMILEKAFAAGLATPLPIEFQKKLPQKN